VIGQESAEEYLQAARAINESGADALWLQHEYGIFGGEDGAMVCDFVDRIAAPLVVTCHTVLAEPSLGQEQVLRHLISRASRIMVMGGHARDLLVSVYVRAKQPGDDASSRAVFAILHGSQRPELG